MESNQLIALRPFIQGSEARGLAQLEAQLLTVDVQSFNMGGLFSNSMMVYIIYHDGSILYAPLNRIPGGYNAYVKTTGQINAIAVVGAINNRPALLLLGAPIDENVDVARIKALVLGAYNNLRYKKRAEPRPAIERSSYTSVMAQQEPPGYTMQGRAQQNANAQRPVATIDAESIGGQMYTPAERTNRMPLIGDLAPAFKAKTTQGDISFPGDYKGKWVILFSHPADFTPVCTTEFMTFAKMHNEFKALNVSLIGLSIDSIYAHIAWLRTIKEKIKYKGMENMEVTFPLIEDIRMEVANKFGMLQPNASTTQAVRAVFFIDPTAKIRCILYYPLTTGRNFDEIKRIVLALQKADSEGVATPADWRPGDDVIIPPAGSCGAAKERMETNSDDKYCLDWFMCFKKEGKSRSPIKFTF